MPLRSKRAGVEEPARRDARVKQCGLESKLEASRLDEPTNIETGAAPAAAPGDKQGLYETLTLEQKRLMAFSLGLMTEDKLTMTDTEIDKWLKLEMTSAVLESSSACVLKWHGRCQELDWSSYVDDQFKKS
jgi:hypothetical protein